MKCKKARSLILELVMETIKEEDEKKLKFHLKNCPQCTKEWTTFRELIATLKSLPLPDPGAEFFKILPLRVKEEISNISLDKGWRTWIKGVFTNLRFLQPGEVVSVLVSLAVVAVLTGLLIFYPSYFLQERNLFFKTTTEDTLLQSSDSLTTLLEGVEESAVIEELSPQELQQLYNSLITSIKSESTKEELFEEKTEESFAFDYGHDLNDLSPDELKLLSQRLAKRYPVIPEKGV